MKFSSQILSFLFSRIHIIPDRSFSAGDSEYLAHSFKGTRCLNQLCAELDHHGDLEPYEDFSFVDRLTFIGSRIFCGPYDQIYP